MIGFAGLLLFFSCPPQDKPAAPEPQAPHPDLVAKLGDTRWTHGEIANCVAINSDATLLATGGWGTIKLWDPKTGNLLRTIDTGRWSIGSIQFSPDGRRIAGSPTDGKIGIWNVQTGDLEKGIDLSEQDINRMHMFSPDLKRVLSGTQTGKIQLWDLDAGKSLLDIDGAGRLTALGISLDHRWIVSGSFTSKTAQIWDAQSGKAAGEFALDCYNITRVLFSSDGKRLLIGASSVKETLTLWDFETRRKLRSFECAWVDSLAYSADGRLVAAGDIKNTAHVWEAESGRRLHTFTDLKARMTGMHFTPDGKQLFATSQNGALGLWNVETGALLSDTDGHRGGVMSIGISQDQRTVWTAGADGRLIRWDLSTGKPTRRLQSKSQSPLCVSFSSDLKTAVIGSQNSPLTVWDLEKGEQLREAGAPFSRSIGLSPDGRQGFARGKKYRDITLWDLTTGEPVRTVRGFAYDCWGVGMSPDGRFVAAGTMHDQEGNDPGTLTVWDARTGDRRWSMPASKTRHSQIRHVVFSPDARHVLCDSFGTISVFDVSDGRRLLEIPANPKSALLSVAISTDGRLGLCGTYDKKVVLWDLVTGKVEREFTGHSGPVTSVAFSPGGRRFISGSEDGTVLVWHPGSDLTGKSADWVRVWRNTGGAERKTLLAVEFAKLGREFETACEARERLLAAGDDVVAAVLEAFLPVSPSGFADVGKLNEILKRLDNQDLGERNQAAVELELVGKGALPWIQQILDKKDAISGEARSVLERARDRLTDATFSMTSGGMTRAVLLLLEMSGSTTAREALERYAQGPEWHYPSHLARRGLGK